MCVDDEPWTHDVPNESAVANFNATDWAWVLGTGLVGLPIGFKTGACVSKESSFVLGCRRKRLTLASLDASVRLAPCPPKNAGLASGGRARIPTMYTGGIIGLMGGFCFALQNSSGRLLGLLPNEAEVEEANRRR